MDIQFQYPLYYLIFPLLLALAGSGVLYFKSRSFTRAEGKPLFLMPLLTGLRFLLLFIIGLLLLSPFLKTRKTESLKPLIILAVDQSSSVLKSLPVSSEEYLKRIRNLAENLSKDYRVEWLHFDQQPGHGLTDSFTGKATNLSKAVAACNERLINQHSAALIIASDGIINQGSDPIYEAEQTPCPIYTIALGDTTIRKDALIKNTRHNTTVSLLDDILIEADIQATYLEGKNSSLQVFKMEGDKAVSVGINMALTYNQNSYFKKIQFPLPAKQSGIQHYRIVLAEVAGESTTQNNSKDIFFEVLDAKKKVLVIASSPHPDLTAIKQSLEKKQHFSVDVHTDETLPTDIKNANLIILHGLPSLDQPLNKLLQNPDFADIPHFFWITSQSHWPGIQKIQRLLSVRTQGGYTQSLAKANESFSLFTVSDFTKRKLTSFPPLQTAFGQYESRVSSGVLLYQQMNGIDTDYPLWILDESKEPRTGILAGEGFWRWRIHDFQQNSSFEITDELLQKSVQFLIQQTDKRPFQLKPIQMIFNENEPVQLEGVLKNASGERVTNVDIPVRITHSSGTSYTFNMSKSSNQYSLQAGFLPSGFYDYVASCQLGGQSYQAKGKFSVRPLQLEEATDRADHALLYRLSASQQGKMVNVSQMESLADIIREEKPAKPILTETYTTRAAIEISFLLFLLIILASAEWVLRKYYGAY